MIEFAKRDDGAVIVSRKGDGFLGVIEKANDDEVVFVSAGSIKVDENELLIIAVAALGLPTHGEIVQDHIARGGKIEIKLTDE